MTDSNFIRLREKPPIYIDRKFAFCLVLLTFVLGIVAILRNGAPQVYTGDPPLIAFLAAPIALAGVFLARISTKSR